MRIFDYGPDVAVQVDRYGSDFSISRLVHTENLHVACMRLRAGGRVGCHPASTHQLFVVVEGDGWVRGAGPDRIPIHIGQAVLWDAGEEHEAGTDTGMVAIVVEGDVLVYSMENFGPVPSPRRTARNDVSRR